MNTSEDDNNVVNTEPEDARASNTLSDEGGVSAGGAILEKVPIRKGTIVANVDFDDNDDVFDEEAEDARVDHLMDPTIDINTGDKLLVYSRRGSSLVSLPYNFHFFILFSFIYSDFVVGHCCFYRNNLSRFINPQREYCGCWEDKGSHA